MSESITEQYPFRSFIIFLLIITFGAFIIYLKQNPIFNSNEFFFLLLVWVYPIFLIITLFFHFFMKSLNKE